MEGYLIRRAKEEDYSQIKDLQNRAHYTSLNEDEKLKEGFVSLQTPLEIIKQANEEIGIVVAEVNSKIVGYEMPLDLNHCKKLPVLDPFIERTLELKHDGKMISEYKVVVEAQINISPDQKGKGIAEDLHREFIKILKPKFDLIITEISEHNPRSLHVHTKKMGLSVIDTWKDEEGTSWYILIQDTRN